MPIRLRMSVLGLGGLSGLVVPEKRANPLAPFIPAKEL